MTLLQLLDSLILLEIVLRATEKILDRILRRICERDALVHIPRRDFVLWRWRDFRL